MLTELRIQNFKSWADTGLMRLAPITGFFGTNSSGKSSILQFLLMLKQTVEATDRSQVLNFGDTNSFVELGTFYDVIHNHKTSQPLEFSLEIGGFDKLPLLFNASVKAFEPLGQIALEKFSYSVGGDTSGIYRTEKGTYSAFDSLIGELGNIQGTPNYFYDFAYMIKTPTDDSDFDENGMSKFLRSLSGDVLTVYNIFHSIYYIGPLRSHPARIYTWGGMAPSDVGRYGENAIQSLIASKLQLKDVLEHVVYWLKEMGLIEEFLVEPIAKHRREYEVRIKKNSQSPYVSLTDVGFGVSQVLPILALCYYVPEESIILLEQPEIHLHPSAQSVLADFLIDVIKERKLQIILESHSEHLLRRLQRRIAEEKLSPDAAALYFCEIENGISSLTSLSLDPFGNITNWPKDFFGDEMGELHAMTVAGIKRKRNGHESHIGRTRKVRK